MVAKVLVFGFLWVMGLWVLSLVVPGVVGVIVLALIFGAVCIAVIARYVWVALVREFERQENQ